MTLEERYNSAAASTYVGKVKDMQAADAGTVAPGVNFMDGDGKGQWVPGATAVTDLVQTEFKRNAAGDYRYGGGGKTPAGTNNGSFPLSRWLTRGLQKGDDYMRNNRFTTISDARNASNLVYKFNPTSPFIGTLSNRTQGKVNGGASGPSPSGING